MCSWHADVGAAKQASCSMCHTCIGSQSCADTTINIGVPGSHPNGQLCFCDTDGNRIRLEVCWSDTLHKKHDIYASFVGIVGNLWADPGPLRSKMFCIYVKPTHISVLNFTAGVATLVQRGSGPWWSQRILSWPPLLRRGPACWQRNDITRGALCPPFWERWNFAHKGCVALLSAHLSGRSTFENP